MEAHILSGPDNAAAHVKLASGQTCTAEGGAMIAMSPGIQVQTTTHKRSGGGILKALARTFAGESLFLNHFTASTSGGDLYLAPTLSGDMLVHQLQGERLIVQAGSFVACEEAVALETSWQGFKNMFSGESLFWLTLSGSGLAILNAFGAIYSVEVDGAYIVDTGHIVAFEDSLDFSIRKVGNSWMSAFLGGEGLVCRFEGHGRLWCQSHNPSVFGKTLGAKLRPRQE